MKATSIDLHRLQHYFLLGGLTGADLWPAINVVVFSYLLLLFVPRWNWTPTLTLVTPCFHSILYVGSLFSFMMDPKEDAPDVNFSQFEGVATMFQDPDIVFPAWIHYIIFDLLVSRQIVLDSVQRGASVMIHVLVVIPCVFCTFAFGPTGFLGYMILRQVFLPTTAGTGKVKIL